MAPKPLLWLRVYTEITTDHKLRRLPPAQRWLWLALMVLARRSPQPGRLLLGDGVPVTLGDMADEANIPLKEARAGLASFESKQMVRDEGGVWVLIHWNDRQFQTDDVTARVTEWRKSKKMEATPMQRYIGVARNAYVTPPETETETETETESEMKHLRKSSTGYSSLHVVADGGGDNAEDDSEEEEGLDNVPFQAHLGPIEVTAEERAALEAQPYFQEALRAVLNRRKAEGKPYRPEEGLLTTANVYGHGMIDPTQPVRVGRGLSVCRTCGLTALTCRCPAHLRGPRPKLNVSVGS